VRAKLTIEEIDGEGCWMVERGRLTCSNKTVELVSVIGMYRKHVGFCQKYKKGGKVLRDEKGRLV